MILLEELKAIQEDNVDVVKEILARHEVSRDILNKAFIGAAGKGHLEVVKHLLTLKDPEVDYRAENNEAFRRAAENGHLNVVTHLLTFLPKDPSVNEVELLICTYKAIIFSQISDMTEDNKAILFSHISRMTEDSRANSNTADNSNADDNREKMNPDAKPHGRPSL